MVSEVIRPAAVVPELSARQILVSLAREDVRNGGCWQSEPSRWTLYDRPWPAPTEQGEAQLLGWIQVAYGTPSKYEITIYRVTVTAVGTTAGWDVDSLTNAALQYGDLTLDECPRATMGGPPKPFRF